MELKGLCVTDVLIKLKTDTCLIYMFTFLSEHQCCSATLNLPFFHVTLNTANCSPIHTAFSRQNITLIFSKIG